jgi:hypothetical protein
MKLIPVLAVTALLAAGTAQAQVMKWSQNPNPALAGEEDGARYADFLAVTGIVNVDFDTAKAGEKFYNPRWTHATEDEYLLYSLSFLLDGFDNEAAKRGLISPNGKPYTVNPPQSGVAAAKFVDELAAGNQEPSPTPFPKPTGSATLVSPALTEKEIADNIAKEKAAEAKRLESLDKLRESLIRESQGSDTVIGAKPAPQ